jgi:hypothetical protein
VNEKLKVLSIVFFLVLISFLSILPPDISKSIKNSGISGEDIKNHIFELTKKPHPIGSQSHKDVQSYISNQLKSFGYEVHVQENASIRSVNNTVSVASVKNLYAIKRGSASDKSIVVLSHYDTQVNSLGAGDASASIAIILELANKYNKIQSKNDIIFLFTDAEENGLLGSKLFLEKFDEISKIHFAINLEGRGSSGSNLLFELSEGNSEIIYIAKNYITHLNSSSLFFEVYDKLPNDTDFSNFKNKGILGVNFAFIDKYINYHSVLDSIENLNFSSVMHQAANVNELLEFLINSDLEISSNSNSIFFPIPFLGIFIYPSFLQGLTILMILPLMVRILTSLKIKNFIYLSFSYLLIILFSLGITLVLEKIIYQIQPEYILFSGKTLPKPEYFYFYFILFVLGFFLFGYTLLIKIFERNLLKYSLFLLNTLNVIFIFNFISTAAFLFYLPFFFVLLGEIRVLYYKEDIDSGKIINTRLAFFVPTVFIILPNVFLLFQSFSIGMAYLPVFLFLICLSNFLPILEIFEKRDIQLFSIFMILLSGFSFMVGLSKNQISDENPYPVHIKQLIDYKKNEQFYYTEKLVKLDLEKKIFSNEPEYLNLDFYKTCFCLVSNSEPILHSQDNISFEKLLGNEFKSIVKIDIESSDFESVDLYTKNGNILEVKYSQGIFQAQERFSSEMKKRNVKLFISGKEKIQLQIEVDSPNDEIVLFQKKTIVDTINLDKNRIPASASFYYSPFHSFHKISYSY